MPGHGPALLPSVACPGQSVDSLVACAGQNHKSQFAEDVSLLPTLLLAQHGARRHAFVELGAYDGVRGSNTFLLEKCCNWTGTLIEANPANFAALQRSPRRATRVHSGVCNATGRLAVSETGGVFAGAVETVDPKYAHRARGRVEVPCDTLTAVLDGAAHPRHVDFLSLDVEGAEETVLRNLDLSRVGLLVLETARLPPERAERVDALLRAGGLARSSAVQIRASAVWARPALEVVPFAPQLYPPRFQPAELRAALEAAAWRRSRPQ
jgi:FkbM family methyltransferase